MPYVEGCRRNGFGTIAESPNPGSAHTIHRSFPTAAFPVCLCGETSCNFLHKAKRRLGLKESDRHKPLY